VESKIRNNFKILAATAVIIVVLDQLTKAIVMQSMAPYESIEVIPGFFNLVFYMNQGAAFGILNEGGLARKLFLIGTSLAALAIVAVLVWQSRSALATVALSLIAGGAIGNLIDRARFGFVIDFLDFFFSTHHWPAFNVADSAITVGVGLTLVIYLFLNEKTGQKAG